MTRGLGIFGASAFAAFGYLAGLGGIDIIHAPRGSTSRSKSDAYRWRPEYRFLPKHIDLVDPPTSKRAKRRAAAKARGAK